MRVARVRSLAGRRDTRIEMKTRVVDAEDDLHHDEREEIDPRGRVFDPAEPIEHGPFVRAGGADLQPLRAAPQRGGPRSRSKRWVKTVAKQKAATCQNHTLVKRNPTPKPSSPTNDTSIVGITIDHAFQYIQPPS